MNVDTSWRDQAACQTEDPELWYPAYAGRVGAAITDQARRICLKCDVRSECLEFALATGDDWGVWGGHTAEERRLIQRRRKREAEAAKYADEAQPVAAWAGSVRAAITAGAA